MSETGYVFCHPAGAGAGCRRLAAAPAWLVAAVSGYRDGPLAAIAAADGFVWSPR